MEVAIVGLAGVIIGAILQHVLGRWSEGARWAREDRHRWVKDKRELYARFTAATNEYDDALRANARAYHVATANSDVRLRSFDQPDRLSVVMEELRLIAPSSVVQAAEHVAEILDEEADAVQMLYVSSQPVDIAAEVERAERYLRARSGFVDAARADLGVEGLHGN